MNKRQIQHKKTVEAIRKAVDRLVKEHGFEKMRVIDICKEVGIAEGTFYYYYNTKNDLLRDRLIRSNSEIMNYYHTELADINEVDGLQKFVVMGLEYARSRVLEVHISYQKARMDNAEAWEIVRTEARRYILRALVEKGMQKKSIRSSYTPDQIIDYINCCMEGIVCENCLTRGEFLARTQVVSVLNDWIETLRA